MLLDEPFGGLIPGARGAVLSTLLRTDARLTGRQVHALVSDRHSLWSVQEALKAWVQLGVVQTEIVGRAVVHAINEDHYTVAPLRSLLDPMAALTKTAAQVVGADVEAVIVFGSVARSEAKAGSDIDLAVIAQSGWDGRVDLEDAVRKRLGNDCDVLVFTTEDFTSLAADHEPVVDEIIADGIPLIGSMPRAKNGAARWPQQST
jgi:predicted nucleotidyltransferase